MGKGPSNFMPLTPERLQKYLDALRETANYTTAARIATPTAKGADGARSTFEKYRQEHPEYDQACKEAIAEAVATLDGKVFERAMNGACVERRTLPDGSVLERFAFDPKREQFVLARHMPEYRPHSYVELSANVTATAVPFDPALLAGLNREEREALRVVLQGVARVAGELGAGGGSTPAQIEAGRFEAAKPVQVPAAVRTRPNRERYSDDPRQG